MTPQQAVNRLVRTEMSTNNRDGFRSLFEKVAATAKRDETRRCAALVKQSCTVTGDALMIAFGKGMAKNLLITGGLEVDVPDGKMKPDGPAGSSL